MKIAIISDIHGNIISLEAVLEELEKNNVDKIICLGDLISGAAWSEEVIKRIIEQKDKCICVQGNQEKYIIEGMPKIFHDEKIKTSKEQFDKVEWVKKQLSDESKRFVYNLPKELIIKIGNKRIYIAHYPMKADKSYKKHIQKPTAEELHDMFSDKDADIFLYGHTHEKNYKELGGGIYINPGALGCPGKGNEAQYGILEIDANNNVNYKQFGAKYDVENVINDIKKIQFPDYKTILKLFYGK